MIRVAVVEDNENDFNILNGHIEKYAIDKSAEILVTHFIDGINFIDEENGNYDIVFMDIGMTHLDGMSTAIRLRSANKFIAIVFVTNIAQYAVKGYEVNAVAFMVKPVDYFSFATIMDRAVLHCKTYGHNFIIISDRDYIAKVPVEDITYVDIDNHKLTYHTAEKNYYESGTLKDAECKLNGYHFSRCINGCLVNLSAVKNIYSNTVTVGNENLPLSRHKKKSFINDFMKYLGKVSK